MTCAKNSNYSLALVLPNPQCNLRLCVEPHICQSPNRVPRQCARDFTSFSDDCREMRELLCCRKCVPKAQYERSVPCCECPDRDVKSRECYFVELLPGTKHPKYEKLKIKHAIKMTDSMGRGGICKSLKLGHSQTIEFSVKCKSEEFGIYHNEDLTGEEAGYYRDSSYFLFTGKVGKSYYYGYPNCPGSGGHIRIERSLN